MERYIKTYIHRLFLC